ncbi:hypothetical protein B0H11DRAFT_2282178 [Mycena galericulata]|nr:hypothetical protein B0H11DRAFT_2282178 [Mycena galericulata]
MVDAHPTSILREYLDGFFSGLDERWPTAVHPESILGSNSDDLVSAEQRAGGLKRVFHRAHTHPPFPLTAAPVPTRTTPRTIAPGTTTPSSIPPSAPAPSVKAGQHQHGPRVPCALGASACAGYGGRRVGEGVRSRFPSISMSHPCPSARATTPSSHAPDTPHTAAWIRNCAATALRPRAMSPSRHHRGRPLPPLSCRPELNCVAPSAPTHHVDVSRMLTHAAEDASNMMACAVGLPVPVVRRWIDVDLGFQWAPL